MEGYLETIVTVLIGLGAVLISALNKKKESGAPSGEPGEELQYIEEVDDYPISASFEKEPNEKNKIVYSENNHNEKEKVNNIYQSERTVVNQNKLQDKDKKPLKQSAKYKFNARKAIIYSTIINRKYS